MRWQILILCSVASHYWLLNEDAANNDVEDIRGSADGNVQNANTEDIHVTGPIDSVNDDWLAAALEFDDGAPPVFISIAPATVSDADDFTIAYWAKRNATSDKDRNV